MSSQNPGPGGTRLVLEVAVDVKVISDPKETFLPCIRLFLCIRFCLCIRLLLCLVLSFLLLLLPNLHRISLFYSVLGIFPAVDQSSTLSTILFTTTSVLVLAFIYIANKKATIIAKATTSRFLPIRLHCPPCFHSSYNLLPCLSEDQRSASMSRMLSGQAFDGHERNLPSGAFGV